MDSLREMFGEPSWSLRHEAIKYIYTKQIKEGIFVREHVLDMMMHFNIAEVNGGPINEANQRFYNLTMGKGKEVETNVATTEKELVGGSSSKTRVGTLNMKKKRKGKTPKNSEGKKVAKVANACELVAVLSSEAASSVAASRSCLTWNTHPPHHRHVTGSGCPPPEPKRFGVRPDKVLDVLGASLSLIFRLGTGIFVDGYSVSLVPKNDFPPDKYALEISGFKVKETSKLGPRPEKPIEIYEFERYIACSVREIVAVLDLDILFYPCPRNGPNFRPKVLQMGGKQQFPYMVDPNTGVSMYELDDIIKYLVQNYGVDSSQLI
ncbi:Glutaredoxin active site-containing protein [Cucumis melo var. makuwa]|uniref:Glutaredoxin active site-containing protein n=1 Tax=Cucumis melo var. makuwa TaxID=1194695 RepID=A0A5A7VKI4_CUCMM|nr:Glutaredoxin active site-containing protein [Cucumis melo var. makuwa]